MKSLNLIRKLVVSQMRLHPTRAIITIVGFIASTCAVVWVVSGYDSLVAQFDENAQKYLGRYDVLVLPAGPPGSLSAVNQTVVESLTNDPGVLELNPITQSRVSVTRASQPDDQEEKETPLGLLIGSRPPVNGAPPVDPILVSTPAVEAPYDMVDGEWFADQDESDLPSAIISEGAAEQINVSVGDEVLITSIANQKRLRIVGIVEQAQDTPSLASEQGGRGGPGRGKPDGEKEKPKQKNAREDSKSTEIAAGETTENLTPAEENPTSKTQLGLPNAYVQGPATNAVYVRPEIAEQINGFPARANVLQIALRDGVTTSEFESVWKSKFKAASPPLRIVDYDTVRSGMESTRSISGQRSQAWAATGMASIAAVFIIFSTLSMGVSERAREFAMLRAIALTRSQLAGIIALESVTLALFGWIGGLLAGWVLLTVGNQLLPSLFHSSVTLGWTCVLLSGITVLAGALGAAIIPAWRAMRIKPLDAMTTQTKTPHTRWWIFLGCAGIVLAASAPLSVFFIPMSDTMKTWTYSFVTWPALLVGMILLTPAVVLLCERLFGPLVTRLLGLDPRLVRTQLSSNMWRTIGATLALSLGLALFASTQTWGYSMLQPFLPGDWLPDMLVAFHPVGLDEDGIEAVKQVKGVKPDKVMPLAIEQTQFDWSDAENPGLRQDNAVIFGLEPERAFGTDHPFLDVNFVEGDRQSIIEALATGEGCVISEDFQMSTGFKVGDELSFSPPNTEGETVTYRIAGVVSLPGWHWITKFSGVRRHFVRTATMIFASRRQVQKDFHLARNEFYWLNLDGSALLSSIEADMQKIAESNSGGTFQATDVGEVTAYRPFARATATETVRRAISLHADATIWRMSQLPLVTLIIMSLAVANAIFASVRSRTWEFGILRSVGITRWQLVRLIITETILIGLVACILSLAFGLTAGWCGVGMAQYGRWFAGPATFLIPWKQLAFGFSITLALCLLAGLWPAIRSGRAEPLTLLKAGRSSI
ncbi:ABC transporter permease [Thalassoglobus polymorphus]|uniref:FtsX-like permease family protein n=1 Tax=Thalassoglobus polymorphus TaxID=2527994 RepID=A0A517QNB3_9PLAN|nr:ABC transporter permease [Thalassoglobus polymorphus]QDT33119.1 FtsX-like permease family protein [Thalassoglobus polymorphus]